MSEPPMIKALRKDRFNLFEMMLEIDPKILSYDDVICLQDETARNVLHHAVIK